MDRKTYQREYQRKRRLDPEKRRIENERNLALYYRDQEKRKEYQRKKAAERAAADPAGTKATARAYYEKRKDTPEYKTYMREYMRKRYHARKALKSESATRPTGELAGTALNEGVPVAPDALSSTVVA